MPGHVQNTVRSRMTDSKANAPLEVGSKVDGFAELAASFVFCDVTTYLMSGFRVYQGLEIYSFG